jgi:carbamoyl-phosphate synthase large subunit
MLTVVKSVEKGVEYAKQVGYPIIVSPHFSSVSVPLGTATDEKQLTDLLKKALRLSRQGEVTLESL